MENKNPGSASSGSESAPRSPAPGPDVMLGVWSSSMDAAFSPTQQWSDILRDFGAQWWQVTPDSAAGDLLASNVKQLNDLLAKDPVLRAIDQLWNANPLRDIVPVD
jgi:polyhydroxyalkanoate synthase subunit PhaC